MTQALARLETTLTLAAVALTAALLCLAAVGWRVMRRASNPMQAELGK